MSKNVKLTDFISLTGATEKVAKQFMQLAENDLDTAVSLFFDNNGIPLLDDDDDDGNADEADKNEDAYRHKARSSLSSNNRSNNNNKQRTTSSSSSSSSSRGPSTVPSSTALKNGNDSTTTATHRSSRPSSSLRPPSSSTTSTTNHHHSTKPTVSSTTDRNQRKGSNKSNTYIADSDDDDGFEKYDPALFSPVHSSTTSTTAKNTTTTATSSSTTDNHRTHPSDDFPFIPPEDDYEDTIRAPIQSKTERLMQGPSLLSTLPKVAPKSVTQDPSIWGPTRRSTHTSTNNNGNNNNTRNNSTNLSSSSSSVQRGTTNLSSSSSSSSGGSRDLSKLFSMPSNLNIFRGTFEDVREYGRQHHRWVIIHLHQALEFRSWAIIRDVWTDNDMIELINNYFVFWQQDDELTTERKNDYGQKESVVSRNMVVDRLLRYYNITNETYPMILLIDPRAADLVWFHQGGITLKRMYERLTNFLMDHSWEDPRFIEGVVTSSSPEDMNQLALKKQLQSPITKLNPSLVRSKNISTTSNGTNESVVIDNDKDSKNNKNGSTVTSLSSTATTNTATVLSSSSASSSSSSVPKNNDNKPNNKRHYDVITIDDDDDDGDTSHRTQSNVDSPKKKRTDQGTDSVSMVQSPASNINMNIEDNDSEHTDYGLQYSDDDIDISYSTSSTSTKKPTVTAISTTSTGTTNNNNKKGKGTVSPTSNHRSDFHTTNTSSTTSLSSVPSKNAPTNASSVAVSNNGSTILSSSSFSNTDTSTTATVNDRVSGQKRTREINDENTTTHHYNHNHQPSHPSKHTVSNISSSSSNSMGMRLDDEDHSSTDQHHHQMIHLPTVFNSPSRMNLASPVTSFGGTGNTLQSSTTPAATRIHPSASTFSSTTTTLSSGTFYQPPEPSSTVDPQTITRIRFRLPNGTTLIKKVYLRDPITILYAIVSYELRLNHPLTRRYFFQPVDTDNQRVPYFHINTVIPPVHSLHDSAEQGKQIQEENLANVTLVVTLV